MAGPCRTYCGVFNTNDSGRETPLLAPPYLTFGERVKYAVWQKEKGEQLGKEHFQIYFELDKPMRMAGARAACGEWAAGMQLQKRRGTQEEAKEYCEKEETRLEGPWYHGEFVGQGKRSDLATMGDLLTKEKKRLGEVMVSMPAAFMRNCNGARALAAAMLPQRYGRDQDMPQVIVFFGASGTGKTRTAVQDAIGGRTIDVGGEQVPDWSDVYLKNGSDKWWDGFEGQRNVIIDEMESGLGSVNALKGLCDRYPYSVEYKGGKSHFAARRIWITANKHPREWYNNLSLKDKQALARRFTELWRYNDDGTKVQIKWVLDDNQDTDEVVDPQVEAARADASRFL